MLILPYIIHRVVTDRIFRTQFQVDPHAALLALNLSLNDEDFAIILEVQHLFDHQSALPVPANTNNDQGWLGGPSFTHAALDL